MRNPERSRNLALAACVAGLPMFLSAFLLPESAGDGLLGFLFSAGLMSFLFGGVAALVLHQRVKAKLRMDRGELLARWRFTPEQWRAFLALDKERNERGDRLRNEFAPREEIPAEGIEVRVGEDAVEIDGSLHGLPRHDPRVTRAEFDESRVRPSVVELDLSYAGDGISARGTPGGPREALLRFPVPAGQQLQARGIAAHFLRISGGKPDFFHGRGDGSDPEDLTRCWQCGFETHRLVARCERCGATMVSRRWSRRYGAILIVLGLVLSVGMAILLDMLWSTLMHPGVQVGNSTFTGSRAMANLVILVLGSVLVFGLTTLGYGIFQVATGRRSLPVVRAMLAIVGGLYLLGWAISAGLL